MANNKPKSPLESTIADYLNISEDDLSELAKSWNKHIHTLMDLKDASESNVDTPTSDDQDLDDSYIDLNQMSLTDKLTAITDETLNAILTEQLTIESGTELLDVANTVALVNRLNNV